MFWVLVLYTASNAYSVRAEYALDDTQNKMLMFNVFRVFVLYNASNAYSDFGNPIPLDFDGFGVRERTMIFIRYICVNTDISYKNILYDISVF